VAEVGERGVGGEYQYEVAKRQGGVSRKIGGKHTTREHESAATNKRQVQQEWK
jgi:hypothetical protein